MIIYINTTEKITEIKLYDDNVRKIGEAFFEGSFILSEQLIQRSDLMLHDSGFSKKDLKGVAVNIGPGSYTGVRIGVTTANSIAFALNIPIIKISNQKDVEKELKKTKFEKVFSSPVLPIYHYPPHITKKR